MMYILNLVGTTVETSLSVVLYVEIQKSSFIVPPVQNLGKSYTLMTYWDETVHSSESWFVISAPVDSTSVYLDSAHVKRFSPSFHKTWLHQGDVFRFDLNERESVFVRCRFDLSGIIINGSEVCSLLWEQWTKTENLFRFSCRVISGAKDFLLMTWAPSTFGVRNTK